jgi:hypothetical protein
MKNWNKKTQFSAHDWDTQCRLWRFLNMEQVRNPHSLLSKAQISCSMSLRLVLFHLLFCCFGPYRFERKRPFIFHKLPNLACPKLSFTSLLGDVQLL